MIIFRSMLSSLLRSVFFVCGHDGPGPGKQTPATFPVSANWRGRRQQGL